VEDSLTALTSLPYVASATDYVGANGPGIRCELTNGRATGVLTVKGRERAIEMIKVWANDCNT
jgi:hypothetical protein